MLTLAPLVCAPASARLTAVGSHPSVHRTTPGTSDNIRRVPGLRAWNRKVVFADSFGRPRLAPKDVALTPQVVIVFSDYGLAALDRRTGRELWRKPAPHGASWSLGGYTTGGNQEILALQDQYTPPGDITGRVRTTGVESRTGRALWQWDVPTPAYNGIGRWLVGVWGDVLVTGVGHGDSIEKAELRSADTGQILDPASIAGKAAIRNAIAHAGQHDVYFQDAVIDLETGNLEKRLPPRLADISGYRIPHVSIMFENAKRVIVNIDTDNGMMGHSVYPKYVACSDILGDTGWQFPRAVKYPDYQTMAEMEHNHVWAAAVFPRAGIVVASNEANDLFGLAMTSGRVIWRRGGRGRLGPPIKVDGDCVLLYTDRRRTWIARLVPANGRVKRIARDAGATWIAADTNGVAALARNGLLKYFRIEARHR